MEGVTRTPKEWSRFWNDYKCRVQAKVAKINRGFRATRGRPTMAQQLTPLEERVAALLGRDATGAASTSSAEHTPAAPDLLSTTVKVDTPPIVTEHEQKDPDTVESGNQPADEGTTLPQSVRPRNQRQRRSGRRFRRRRQSTTAALKEIRAAIAWIEEILIRSEETAAVIAERKLEAWNRIVTYMTSIVTSLDIISMSLDTYVPGLQRNN